MLPGPCGCSGRGGSTEATALGALGSARRRAGLKGGGAVVLSPQVMTQGSVGTPNVFLGVWAPSSEYCGENHVGVRLEGEQKENTLAAGQRPQSNRMGLHPWLQDCHLHTHICGLSPTHHSGGHISLGSHAQRMAEQKAIAITQCDKGDFSGQKEEYVQEAW
jgi:hypothetical protein